MTNDQRSSFPFDTFALSHLLTSLCLLTKQDKKFQVTPPLSPTFHHASGITHQPSGIAPSTFDNFSLSLAQLLLFYSFPHPLPLCVNPIFKEINYVSSYLSILAPVSACPSACCYMHITYMRFYICETPAMTFRKEHRDL